MGKATVSGGANMTVPVGLPTLNTLAVGSTLRLNVNGVSKEFLVVHQGKPSSLYDDSCDGVWLLMKDIHELRGWWEYAVTSNDYENSELHSYLNSAFLGLFDSHIQSAIKQVKIPYRKGSGSETTTISGGADGLSAKVFLLSSPEAGFNHSYMLLDGSELSYFSDCVDGSVSGVDADDKRIANYNGEATAWWLRSPCYSPGSANGNTSLYVGTDGGWTNASGSYPNHGIRPALILPSTAKLTADGTIKI